MPDQTLHLVLHDLSYLLGFLVLPLIAALTISEFNGPGTVIGVIALALAGLCGWTWYRRTDGPRATQVSRALWLAVTCFVVPVAMFLI
jgi:hypothetical protein